MMEYVIAFLVISLILLYFYFTWHFDYWKNQGIDSAPGAIPGFGHMLPVLFTRENPSLLCKRYYKLMKGKSKYGIFFLRTPCLLVRDPELVKSILVTSFANFSNNALILNPISDPLLCKNPFFATDTIWKESRVKLLAIFSSKKLRLLFTIVHGVCMKMKTFLDRKIESNSGKYEVELKEFFMRFTGEVSANCGFGIEGCSFEDNPSPQSYSEMIKNIFQPSFTNGIQQSLRFYVPEIGDMFGARFLSKEVDHFFRDITKSILKDRLENKTCEKNDVLHFALEDMEDPDVEVLAARLVAFFADVYESSSTVAAATTYYLSQHPDIQRKVRHEITSVLRKHNEEITYESLKEMTYLEQVLQESLRMVPILDPLFKTCTKDCTLTGSNGQSCTLRKGQLIFIPVLGLHTDETFWKDPETFDPDRFHPDKKSDIVKFTYLPFGEGPRICVGMRFGIMQVKAALVTVLRNCSLEVSTKTKVPFQFDPRTFLTTVKGGLWARFERLTEN